MLFDFSTAEQYRFGILLNGKFDVRTMPDLVAAIKLVNLSNFQVRVVVVVED
jgi:hypothetical protein